MRRGKRPGAVDVLDGPADSAGRKGGFDVVEALTDAIGNRVLRVAEGGRVLDEISTGKLGVFACMLGGPDRRTLFLCVAPDFHEHQRTNAREAAIWTVAVDVPGAGLP